MIREKDINRINNYAEQSIEVGRNLSSFIGKSIYMIFSNIILTVSIISMAIGGIIFGILVKKSSK